MKTGLRYLAFLALALVCGQKASALNVTTWQVDNTNRGLNASETVLTPTLISTPGKIGLLFNQTVQGQVYAQPLYLENILVNGVTRNVVYVATEGNYVYCFDADSNIAPNDTYLWRVNLSPAGTTTVPQADTNSGDITTEIGITGTPVIDAATNTLYVISKCKRSGTVYEQYINALDTRTGAHKFGSPVLINPTYPGTGNGSVGGVISFNALKEHNRPSLTLHNGIVYAGFASHSDSGPYHGWLLGFNASNLTIAKKFIAAPNQDQAGIWMSGAKPPVDPQGFLHVLTGNGNFSTANSNYGEAFLKLSTTGTFSIDGSNTLNWFVPNNWNTLNGGDLDLGAGGALILPDQTGPHPRLVIGGGKGGVLYVIDRDNMGGNATPDNSVQQIAEGGGGNRREFCTPAYFNGFIYYAPTGSPLLQRSVGYNAAAGTYVNPTPISSNWTYNGGKGAGAFITANGTSNGIVWVISAGTPSELHAYNATSVAGDPIFKYTTKFGASQINETASKYTMPVVSNGKIYLTANSGTNTGRLYVLGQLEGQVGTPNAPTNLVASGAGSSQIALTWTDASTNESNFSIKRATAAAGPYTQVFLASANVTTYTDTGLSPSTTYYYQVNATNSVGSSVPSNTATSATFPSYAENGLVAYWPFDEGVGSVQNDVTGNGNNGSNTGAETTWVAGENTNATYNGLAALNFHGAGNAVSRVVIPDKPTLRFTAAQSFTISAWVNSANVNSLDRAIFAKSRGAGNYYGLWQSAANQWVFRGPGGDVVGPAAVQGAWVHLVGVQDGAANTRKLYVNGTLAATGTAQAADGNGELWIGQTPLTPAQSFAGIIDEVRLYNRALSATEVTNLKTAPSLLTTSKQTQGAAGTFSKIVGPSSYKILESRRGATQGTYDVVLNFAVPVSGIAASLQLQAGGTPVGATGAVTYTNANKTVTIRLTGIGNVQGLNIRITGIQPGSGTLDIPFNILWGDVNSDNVVNNADVTLVQGNQVAAVNGTTFIYDVNCDGIVNGTDTSLVQGWVGTNLGGQTNNLLSLNKPAVASSSQDPILLAPGLANDASDAVNGTRWASLAADPQWLYIDLEQTCNVRSIVLNWETAGGKNYTLEVADSTSGPWSNLATITNNTIVNAPLTYTVNGNGRYVRMNGTARTGTFGYSLWDFKVLGSVGGGNPLAPVITSALTKSGVVGTALTYQITATNTPSSYGASALPPGLTINTATGAITGTPTTANTYNSTITATNANGSDTKTLVFTITGGGAAPVINSALTKAGTVGTALSYTITATNTPTSFTATPLPAGLSLNATTGVISGTPTAAATTNTTITASNASGTDTKTLVFTITTGGAAPVINSALTKAGSVGTALTYTITATNTPTSFTATPLPAGLTLNTTTGVISGTPTAAATTNTTITATNASGTDTKTLVFTITPAGDVNLALTGTATASSVENVGTPASMANDNNQGTRWSSTAQIDPSSITIDLGQSSTIHSVVLTWENAGGKDYTIDGSADGVTFNIPIATVTGNTVTGAANPLTYGAPGGAVTARYVRVNGTARILAPYGYSLWEFQIWGTIGGGPAPVINSALTKSGTVGTALSYTITATNTPTSFGATGLPAGLSVNTTTGVISGTPTAIGTTNSTITATNANGTDTKTLVFTISTASSNLALNKPVTVSSFQAGNTPAQGNDGNGTTRWAAVDGTFPQWWQVDLGATTQLARVEIDWINATTRSYKYKIEGGTDGVNFPVMIKDNTANTTLGATVDPTTANVRYIRITTTGSSSGGFASFYECRVF